MTYKMPLAVNRISLFPCSSQSTPFSKREGTVYHASLHNTVLSLAEFSSTAGMELKEKQSFADSEATEVRTTLDADEPTKVEPA